METKKSKTRMNKIREAYEVIVVGKNMKTKENFVVHRSFYDPNLLFLFSN